MATRQQQSRQAYAGVFNALENDPRIGAIPAGGTTGQVLAKTSSSSYATAWTTPAAGGSGSNPVRATATFTTSGAVADTHYTGSIAMATGYRLLALQTSSPARVRLYTDTASMSADQTRLVTVAEADNSGLVIDYVTGGSTVQKIAPALSGYSMESTPSSNIPIIVTPTTSVAVTVTLTYVATE